MNISQLTEIVVLANKKQIRKRLKAQGYTDCKKHKELQNLSVETLFKGDLLETETFQDSKGKRFYEGGIFTNVKGYERLEFIIININDYKNTFPIDLLICAKEV